MNRLSKKSLILIGIAALVVLVLALVAPFVSRKNIVPPTPQLDTQATTNTSIENPQISGSAPLVNDTFDVFFGTLVEMNQVAQKAADTLGFTKSPNSSLVWFSPDKTQHISFSPQSHQTTISLTDSEQTGQNSPAPNVDVAVNLASQILTKIIGEEVVKPDLNKLSFISFDLHAESSSPQEANAVIIPFFQKLDGFNLSSATSNLPAAEVWVGPGTIVNKIVINQLVHPGQKLGQAASISQQQALDGVTNGGGAIIKVDTPGVTNLDFSTLSQPQFSSTSLEYRLVDQNIVPFYRFVGEGFFQNTKVEVEVIHPAVVTN